MNPTHPLIKTIKIAWLLVCFSIGVSYFNKGALAGEYMADFLSMMTIVTFPIGYLAIFLVKTMVGFWPETLGNEMVRSYNIAVSLWVLMTILGYFQWFYLLPRLLAKVNWFRNNP